jgi:hypothetical protein
MHDKELQWIHGDTHIGACYMQKKNTLLQELASQC